MPLFEVSGRHFFTRSRSAVKCAPSKDCGRSGRRRASACDGPGISLLLSLSLFDFLQDIPAVDNQNLSRNVGSFG